MSNNNLSLSSNENNNLFDLAKSVPIGDIVSRYANLKASSTSGQKCPFPDHQEKTGSFHIYSETNSFNCFGCGAAGDQISFVAKMFSLRNFDAACKICTDFNLTTSGVGPKSMNQKPAANKVNAQSKQNPRLYELREEAYQFFTAELSKESEIGEVRYLINRGFNPEEIKTAGFGYCPSQKALTLFLSSKGFTSDEIKQAGLANKKFGKTHKIMLPPWRDSDGKILAFIARATDPNDSPKYLYTAGFKKTIPYGLSNANDKTKLILVEGQMDAILCNVKGIEGVISLGGSSLTEGYFDTIKDLFQSNQLSAIYLALDQDNPGQAATYKLTEKLLEIPGLNLYYVNWPAGFKDPAELIQAMGVDAFRKALEEAVEVDKKAYTDTYSEWRKLLEGTIYNIDGKGRLYYTKYSPTGNSLDVPISNFICRPVKEIVRDNGSDKELSFLFEGIAAGGKRLETVKVPADKFSNLSWVPAKWGLMANIEPGNSNREKVRHCIQCLGQDIPRDIIFTSIGWRKQNGKWIYVHAGGAIGTDDASVDMSEGDLCQYILPDPTEGDIVEGIKASLSLLDIVPYSVGIPLLSLIYLSPLVTAFRLSGNEPAFAVWLVGQTGCMKSTIASLFLSHFGDFNGRNLPSSFKDSSNSLEKKAFLAGDALLVIDDFHPTASQQEARTHEQLAQQLLRGYGDRTGRARMNADTSLRKAYVPRGMALVTGEDMPSAGQSTTARFLAVELLRQDIKIELLSVAQTGTDKLRRSMAGYIGWLLPQIDGLPEKMKKVFVTYRDQAQNQGQHLRLPAAVSWLYIGFLSFTEFAIRSGALSSEERNELLKRAWETLIQLAERQARLIEADTPSKQFINAIRELLATEQIFVRDIRNPNSPATGKEFVGWRDGEWFYLLPDSVYKNIVGFFASQGQRFPITSRMLWKQLDAEGLIFTESTTNEKRYLIKKQISGERQRILQLNANVIEDER